MQYGLDATIQHLQSEVSECSAAITDSMHFEELLGKIMNFLNCLLQKEIAVVSTTSAVALLGSVFAFRLRRVGGKHLP